MQIVSINRSRQPQKVWLKFDNSRLLPLRIDDLVVLHIIKFKELSDDELLTIETASAKFVMTEYSHRQIAMSPKTSALLVRKLKQYSFLISKKYGYDPSLLSRISPDIVNSLEDDGLLRHQDYINYVQHRFRGKSVAELNHRLRLAGVHQKIQPSPEDEVKVIKKLLQTKYSRRDLFDTHEKNLVIASLYRKGFALDSIKRSIDETYSVK